MDGTDGVDGMDGMDGMEWSGVKWSGMEALNKQTWRYAYQVRQTAR